MDSQEIGSSCPIEPIFTIESRETFPEILNDLGLLGEGAEIGVQKGHFSFHILKLWKGKKLYSIDPWKKFSTTEYLDMANIEQTDHDRNFKNTAYLLKKFGERSQIFRETSEEASKHFTDGSLDFAYLDAQHHYEAIVQDIQTWWPKIKHLGILSGHDYIPDGAYAFGKFGVKSAVDEFVKNNNLQLILSVDAVPEDYLSTPSWFIVKPR